MKIIVTEDGKDKIRLFVPIKTALKFLSHGVEEEAAERKRFSKEVAACLKAYKKKYGSFVLLEAQEEDGKTVKIFI